MTKRCVFFDRDGIVNRSPGPGYVERREDFHLYPEFVESLRVVARRGYEAVVVTNQRGVGLGRMTMATLDQIHDHLRAMLKADDLHLLEIVSCVANDDGHSHRKPNPGMLLEAAGKHGLDLAKSWMIGDHERDVLAGKRAGCRTVLVGHSGEATAADFRVKEMADLPQFLEKHLDP
jgi:histidinol-phosphate phosphatase family protein